VPELVASSTSMSTIYAVESTYQVVVESTYVPGFRGSRHHYVAMESHDLSFVVWFIERR
jgi:hypothetical protein